MRRLYIAAKPYVWTVAGLKLGLQDYVPGPARETYPERLLLGDNLIVPAAGIFIFARLLGKSAHCEFPISYRLFE
jgi:hypothetical protein